MHLTPIDQVGRGPSTSSVHFAGARAWTALLWLLTRQPSAPCAPRLCGTTPGRLLPLGDVVGSPHLLFALSPTPAPSPGSAVPVSTPISAAVLKVPPVAGVVQRWSSCAELASLGIAPPRPAPGLTRGVSDDGVSLFVMTNSSSSEPWATFSLSICAFLGVWVGGHSGQCCSDHGVPLALGRTSTIALGSLSRAGWLAPVAAPVSGFGGTSPPLPTVTVLVCIPTRSVPGVWFLHALTHVFF